MYKNFAWFVLGYFTAKHVMPIANEVAQRQSERRQQEKEASA